MLAELARLERDAGDFDAAEGLFRQAVANPPYAPEVLLDLAHTLELNGKSEEAARVREQAKAAEKDLLRLRDVTRMINADPGDLQLRVEAGTILLRNHLPAEGLAWINSALDIDPAYRPAHAALADYYADRDAARAEHHRRLAAGG